MYNLKIMNETQTLEIVNVLKTLPAEKITEVKDFALFLHERYGKSESIDESDEWTDEDLRDVTIASLHYFDELENEEAQ